MHRSEELACLDTAQARSPEDSAVVLTADSVAEWEASVAAFQLDSARTVLPSAVSDKLHCHTAVWEAAASAASHPSPAEPHSVEASHTVVAHSLAVHPSAV